MIRQFKVGDIVDGQCSLDASIGVTRKPILSVDGGFYKVGYYVFFLDELTLIRAVDELAKTYKGQFEVGNAPSFNKMLDSLPF